MPEAKKGALKNIPNGFNETQPHRKTTSNDIFTLLTIAQMCKSKSTFDLPKDLGTLKPSRLDFLSRSCDLIGKAFLNSEGHQVERMGNKGQPGKSVIAMTEHWFSRKRNRKRWLFFFALVVSLLLSGCGENKPRVARVGILCGLGVFASTLDGFKAKMSEFGYIEGKNIAYDVQEDQTSTRRRNSASSGNL